MIKKRIALKIGPQGLSQLKLDFNLPIEGKIKARDKAGAIKAHKIGNVVVVYPRHDFRPGTVYACEVTAIVKPEISYFKKLKIIEWPSMDLYSVTSLIKPYQILGFRTIEDSSKKDGIWKAKHNTTMQLHSHIANKRIARIEIGEPPTFHIIGKLRVDATNGRKLDSIAIRIPQSNKRHRVKLEKVLVNHGEIMSAGGIELISGEELNINEINYEKDDNGNTLISLDNITDIGDDLTLLFIWEIKFLPIDFYQDNLGRKSVLKIAITGSNELKQLLKSNKYWNTNHPEIARIAKKVRDKSQIGDIHKILFEFTNRHIKYIRNGVRYTAAEAFESGVGDCSEYSDLLVALHRASGIPSRIKSGLILDLKTKELEGHAWVEFLSERSWKPTDPTWGIEIGSTVTHIDLSTHMVGDIDPPAFSYKYTGYPPDIDYSFVYLD